MRTRNHKLRLPIQFCISKTHTHTYIYNLNQQWNLDLKSNFPILWFENYELKLEENNRASIVRITIWYIKTNGDLGSGN